MTLDQMSTRSIDNQEKSYKKYYI